MEGETWYLPTGRPEHGQHGENRKTHRAAGGAAGRRVDTVLPGGAQFNRGLKLHTDDPWDGKCWGEEEGHRKSNPPAEGREAAWGIFGGDWERQRETPCIECGLMINSLLAEAGLLVLHSVEGQPWHTLLPPSQPFIPPQISVRCPPKPGYSSRPCSSVHETTHTPGIFLPSPLQCLPVTSSQKL